jgi:ATPase family protein associated with various cellular activities (AAA)
MSTKLAWIKKGEEPGAEDLLFLTPEPPPSQPAYINNLSPIVYEAHLTIAGPCLMTVGDKLPLPKTVYNTEKGFIDIVMKGWDNSRGNMGVLMYGPGGTGKSITAKLLARRAGLPVILISSNWSSLPTFLSKIPQEVIIMMDEAEKTIRWDKGEGDGFLTLMDGMLNGNRKLFILTCNEKTVSPHLLDRPGRIKYLKEFKGLHPRVVEEIIKSELTRPEYKDALMTWFRSILKPSMDSLRSMINEINIQDLGPTTLGEIFNVETKEVEVV